MNSSPKKIVCAGLCQNLSGKARHFGDLGDPNSDVSKLVEERGGMDLMPEQGTKPVNKYLPPRPKTSAEAAPQTSNETRLDAGGFLGWLDRTFGEL